MKRLIIILLTGIAVVFGAATTAEAGDRGCRSYSYRSYQCAPRYHHSYHCGPTYYRSYNYRPSTYYRSYNHCPPTYHYRSYNCAPRYYSHGHYSISVPGFGIHFCR